MSELKTKYSVVDASLLRRHAAAGTRDATGEDSRRKSQREEACSEAGELL